MYVSDGPLFLTTGHDSKYQPYGRYVVDHAYETSRFELWLSITRNQAREFPFETFLNLDVFKLELASMKNMSGLSVGNILLIEPSLSIDSRRSSN